MGIIKPYGVQRELKVEALQVASFARASVDQRPGRRRNNMTSSFDQTFRHTGAAVASSTTIREIHADQFARRSFADDYYNRLSYEACRGCPIDGGVE